VSGELDLERVGARADAIRRRRSATVAGGAVLGLAVLVGGFYAIINPTYMALLINTTTGLILLGISFVMYIIGGLWMRSIVKVKF
jgi:tight adherence protein B